MKYFSTALLLFVSTLLMAQQRPFVSSLSKSSGTVGESIIINGSNFSKTASDLRVYFGTGEATIFNATANQLEVQVPNTATYGPVTVADVSTGRSGSSAQFFALSFGGDAFDLANLDDQVDFPTGMQQPYDLCSCDLDGDGLMDVAVSNNSSNSVTIFRNTSTLGTISFQRININIGYNTINTECGDLNGDGLPDLIFTKNQGDEPEQIFVYRNTSSPGAVSFTKAAGLRLPFGEDGFRNARRIVVADIDGDGVSDLVLGTDRDENNSPVFIYRNQTPNTISLSSSPIEVQVPGATKTGSLAVGDINKDGLPDIVAIPNDIPNASIHLLKNTSSPGSIGFVNENPIDFPSQRIEVVLGDYNNDGFLDIATTSSQNNEVEVFINAATGNNFSFEDPLDLDVTRPWGLANADLNGDGLLDIVAASVANGLFVAINNSTDQAAGFAGPVQIATSNTTRNVDVVDLNGDAKPDFAFTHNITQGAFGDLSVVVNRNCLKPELSPTNQTFCTGSPFILSATKSGGASYAWSVVSGDASISPTGDQAEVTVNSGTEVEIRVEVTSGDGSCAEAVSQAFTLTGGTPPPTPGINLSNTGIICSGEDLTLSGPSGQTNYYWTLPDGSELDPQADHTLTLSGITAADAGVYKLRVQGSACVSEAGSVTVSVNEPPAVVINNNGDDNFCEGSSVELQVPEYAGFTYKWRNDDGEIAGADQPTYSADESGNYYVVLISPEGCEKESSAYTVTEVAPPVSIISSDSEICEDVELTFRADSQVEDFDPVYTWNFGDGNTGTGEEVSNAYADPDQYNVSLTTSYQGVASCSHTATETITVSAPPEDLDLTAVGGFEKCPNDSVRLELPANYQSYNWSTGDTSHFSYAKTGPDADQVEISVDVVTDIGCEVAGTYTISNYANSQIEISSSEADISDDVINLESGVSTVALSASNGSDYTWEPLEILQVSANGSSVVVYPQVRETVVSVTGIDAINSCETTASVTIITPGVIPRKTFSPNGDGQGYDCWEILNTDNLQGCTVYVFDQRGRYVFQGESPFDSNCVWNGNIDNGSSEAPEGIYYFIMKCDNSDFNNTGTILLAR